MNRERLQRQAGFTLLEIIITLIVGSIFGAMLVPYLSTSLSQSSEPIFRLNDTLTIRQVVENMTADFNAGSTLADLYTEIGTEGATVTDGRYGTYEVAYKRYVTENGGQFPEDATGDNDFLRITLKDTRTGVAYTAMFADY